MPGERLPNSASGRLTCDKSSSKAAEFGAVVAASRSNAVTRPRLPAFVLAATLLGIGALVRRGGRHLVASTAEQAAATADSSAYSARFVQGTACVWGPGMQTPGVENGKLRSGESLNLIEGLAEIELDLATGGNATVQIEGPARMVLTAEGTPSLTLGKFCTDVHLGFGDFLLETPLGTSHCGHRFLVGNCRLRTRSGGARLPRRSDRVRRLGHRRKTRSAASP